MAREFTDAERIDWLEARARKSPTGISFDMVGTEDQPNDKPRYFRFMRRHFIGEPRTTLRAAIDACIRDVDDYS